MSTEASLLHAICENPDDDTPRLVYSDWLEEHGGPEGLARAEFIRLQIELARLPPYDPGRLDLQERSAVYEDLYGKSWHPEVPEEERWYEQPYRRGFLALLERDARDWLASPDRYCDAIPVEGFWLRELQGVADRVVAHPAFARIRWLTGDLGFNGIASLAATKRENHLAFLVLTENRIGDSELARLANSELPHLQSLDLKFNRQEKATGIVALLRSRSLPQLQELDLTYTDLTLDGLRRLAATPELSRIQTLNLQGNELATEGVRMIARSPHAAGLKKLELPDNNISDEAMRELAESPNLTGLRELCLIMNEIGPAGVAALVKTSALASLTRLLFDSPIGPYGARHLAEMGSTSLRELDLRGCEIGDEGLTALAMSSNLVEVTALELAGNGISDAGAKALAESPYLQNLVVLDLSSNSIGPKGAEALAASPVLRNLRRLDLSRNKIGSRGGHALARSPHLGRLVNLRLSDCKIFDKAARTLAASPSLSSGPCFRIEVLKGNGLRLTGNQALHERWGVGVE
jgi:uncharacterized protein (TIGR02996 family)